MEVVIALIAFSLILFFSEKVHHVFRAIQVLILALFYIEINLESFASFLVVKESIKVLIAIIIPVYFLYAYIVLRRKEKSV